MRVLVTWGSKLGGAEGIAELVVETLREAGHEVVARDVRDAPAPAGFDAAIIGGTVYENRWMGAVRHYVERHARELRRMPTWLFSSGMLDAANPRDVTALAVEIGAIGDVMFGGRHEAERIRAWAAHIAMELPTATPRPISRSATGPWRRHATCFPSAIPWPSPGGARGRRCLTVCR